MWMLVSERVHKGDREDCDVERHVVAVREGARLLLHEDLFAGRLRLEEEEDGGREVVAEEVGELVEGEERAEGDLLDEHDEEKVAGLEEVEGLQELAQAADFLDEERVEGVAGGDGEAGDDEHVEEEVPEGAVEHLHLVGGVAEELLGFGC